MTDQLTQTPLPSPEVTRVACPGCRTLLRFEPEALDFPANCGACDCRFSVGVYLRVNCPSCHHGSKIRESYLGQRVRCARCQHDFLSDDGIPTGAGGRLLVARRLDTDSALPPETVQPFLGRTRESSPSRPEAPSNDRFVEAERLRTEAVAERDRLAQETGLFKAILARLVSTDPGTTAAAEKVEGPKADDAEARRIAEERDHLRELTDQLRRDLEAARAELDGHRDQPPAIEADDRLERQVRSLAGELEAARAEAVSDRERFADELATARREERDRFDGQVLELKQEWESARVAAAGDIDRLSGELAQALQAAETGAERSRRLERELAEAVSDHEQTATQAARLLDGHDEALKVADEEQANQRASIDRLKHAVVSAQDGESEALGRLEALGVAHAEFEAKMNGRLVEERGRVLELARLVAEMKAEIYALHADETGRNGEEFESLHGWLAEERGRVRELSQLVDELKAEIQSHRDNEAGRATALEAELADRERHAEELRQAMIAEVEAIRHEAGQVASLGQIKVARLIASVDEAKATAEARRSEAAALHRDEIERITARLAAAEQAGSTHRSEAEQLQAEIEAARLAIQAPTAEIERLASELGAARLAVEAPTAEAERLKVELEAARLAIEAPMAEAERLKAELEATRQAITAPTAENERLQAELEAARLAIQAPTAEIERLASELGAARLAVEAPTAEVERLKVELEAARSALSAPAAEVEELSRTVERLHAERRELAESSEQIQAENRRLAAELASAMEAESDGPSTATADLEKARFELERRNVALVTELQRIKKEYLKVADTNDQLTDRVRQLVDEKMTQAESAQATAGVRAVGQPTPPVEGPPPRAESLPRPAPSAIDADRSGHPARFTGPWDPSNPIVGGVTLFKDPAPRVLRANESGIHRDLALTILYGDGLNLDEE